mmetsp:Transcript_104568/g.320316  ORF Transcript_104568/g.320316 Transcript_104568/m.320316 type:complete len:201 (+) Transcript_104568:999-1601(+)
MAAVALRGPFDLVEHLRKGGFPEHHLEKFRCRDVRGQSVRVHTSGHGGRRSGDEAAQFHGFGQGNGPVERGQGDRNLGQLRQSADGPSPASRARARRALQGCVHLLGHRARCPGPDAARGRHGDEPECGHQRLLHELGGPGVDRPGPHRHKTDPARVVLEVHHGVQESASARAGRRCAASRVPTRDGRQPRGAHLRRDLP